MVKRGQAVRRRATKRKASTKRNRAPRRVDSKSQNGSLRRELTEARQQLTATREVLEVINASPGAVAPVFEALLEKAMHLCEAAFGFLATYDGELFKFAAQPLHSQIISKPDWIRLDREMRTGVCWRARISYII
jgi:hypothetical protein